MEIALDAETLALLDESAKFRSLSRVEMLQQAIREAAEYDRYYRTSVEKGLHDVEAGRIISNDQMKSEVADLLQKLNTKS